MNKTQENKVLKAMTKCLHAYECLMENTEEESHKWSRYGSVYSCLVCQAMLDITGESTPICCKECPIRRCCGMDSTVNDSYQALINAIHRGGYEEIRDAAILRYEDLIWLLDKNGYEYK